MDITYFLFFAGDFLAFRRDGFAGPRVFALETPADLAAVPALRGWEDFPFLAPAAALDFARVPFAEPVRTVAFFPAEAAFLIFAGLALVSLALAAFDFAGETFRLAGAACFAGFDRADVFALGFWAAAFLAIAVFAFGRRGGVLGAFRGAGAESAVVGSPSVISME